MTLILTVTITLTLTTDTYVLTFRHREEGGFVYFLHGTVTVFLERIQHAYYCSVLNCVILLCCSVLCCIIFNRTTLFLSIFIYFFIHFIYRFTHSLDLTHFD